MKNKYKGKCYCCNQTVQKGEGHFERYKGRWRVIHIECVKKQREEKLLRMKKM